HGSIRKLHSATFRAGTFDRLRCPFQHGSGTCGGGRSGAHLERWLKSTSGGAIGPARASLKPFRSNRLHLVKQMQWVTASNAMRDLSMQRISQIAIVLVTATGLALAQTPVWRHV